jgi:hypothetical protein
MVALVNVLASGLKGCGFEPGQGGGRIPEFGNLCYNLIIFRSNRVVSTLFLILEFLLSNL